LTGTLAQSHQQKTRRGLTIQKAQRAMVTDCPGSLVYAGSGKVQGNRWHPERRP
jgi:hypothetical protein